jgi:serine/threonine protein kinase
MSKVFARKLLRVNESSREAVEHEASVVSSFIKNDGHDNIIKILKIGWLRGSGGIYFIDMELADQTLDAFIRARQACPKPDPDPLERQLGGLQWFDFTHHQRSSAGRYRDILQICAEIACGLEFLHDRKCVHRDLKPGNGVFCGERRAN